MADQGGPPTTDKGKGKAHATDEHGTDSEQTSAMTRVLSTPEMVEHVLYFLPATDLFHARGVSHGYRHLIDNSPKLQRATWLRAEGVLDFHKHEALPTTDDDSDEKEEEATGLEIASPSKASSSKGKGKIDSDDGETNTTDPDPKFCAWVFDRVTSTIKPTRCDPAQALRREGFVRGEGDWFDQLNDMMTEGDRSLLVFPVALNPTIPLKKMAPASVQLCHGCYIGREVPYRLRYASTFSESFLNRRLPSAQAKYWDMFLTQPAMTKVRIVRYWNMESNPDEDGCTLYDPQGLKMRHLFDGFRKIGVKIDYDSDCSDKVTEYIGIEYDSVATVHPYDAVAVENDASGLQCPGRGIHEAPEWENYFLEQCDDVERTGILPQVPGRVPYAPWAPHAQSFVFATDTSGASPTADASATVSASATAGASATTTAPAAAETSTATFGVSSAFAMALAGGIITLGQPVVDEPSDPPDSPEPGSSTDPSA